LDPKRTLAHYYRAVALKDKGWKPAEAKIKVKDPIDGTVDVLEMAKRELRQESEQRKVITAFEDYLRLAKDKPEEKERIAYAKQCLEALGAKR
jgi:hypothetical protein